MKMVLLTGLLLSTSAFAGVTTYNCTSATGKNIFLKANDSKLIEFAIDNKPTRASFFSYMRDGEHILVLSGYANGSNLTLRFGSFQSQPSTTVGYEDSKPMQCTRQNEPDSAKSNGGW